MSNTIEQDVTELASELSEENDRLKAELTAWHQAFAGMGDRVIVDTCLRVHGIGREEREAILATYDKVKDKIVARQK